MATKLIRVQDETFEKLQKLAGKLQAKYGTRHSLDKTIQTLLEEKTPRKNTQTSLGIQNQNEKSTENDSMKWFSLHHREFKTEKPPVSSTKNEQK